jgi:hypothetical protein
MNRNVDDITMQIESLMGETMAKIADAASRQDLASLEGLTRRAGELKQMKEQISAIELRLRSISNGALVAQTSTKPAQSFRREVQIEVTQGMINQNLLTLTEALKRGTIRAGEELTVEAIPSGERFRSPVMASGNKLQERGAIGRFYREAHVNAGDCVCLSETSPGQWRLSKRNGSA